MTKAFFIPGASPLAVFLQPFRLQDVCSQVRLQDVCLLAQRIDPKGVEELSPGQRPGVTPKTFFFAL